MLMHSLLYLIVSDMDLFSVLDMSDCVITDYVMSYVVLPSSGDYTNALAHYEKGITGNNKVSVYLFVKMMINNFKGTSHPKMK